MNTLLVFAAIELAALLLLVVLILAAPEAIEDEKGFRVTGPSTWQKLRDQWAAPPRPKAPPFPSVHGRTHA